MTTITPTRYGIDFKLERDGLAYSDCLWLTKEEYESLTAEQIQAMQNERFDNWLAVVNAPPADEAPTE